MKKCVFVNLNVGSAIEQSGNEIINYIKDIDNLDLKVFSDQTREDLFFNYLLTELPNIIIINGEFPRVITPTIYYKQIYKNTKIVFIARTMNSFVESPSFDSPNDSVYEQQKREIFHDLCNLIICVNSCGKFEKYFPQFSLKSIDCCGLNNPDKFKITKKWQSRNKNFLIFGSLNELKVSPKFLDIIENSDIHIDCYGGLKESKLKTKIENNNNLSYKGFCEFEKVPKLLNEYKYTIFPHTGMELLCNSLIQSILCGTVPIVIDNNFKNIFDDYWLHWGDGFYISTKNENDLFNTLNNLNDNDYLNFSENNRKMFINKYKINNLFRNIRNEINKLVNTRGFKWDTVEHL